MTRTESLPPRVRSPLSVAAWYLSSLRPGWLCLALGLLGALPLVVLTPPLQVPDEMQHFYRAYQLSELDVWASMRGDGAVGALLPSSLPAMTEHFLGTRALHTNRSIAPMPLSRTLAYLGRSLDPGRREFVDFSSTAPYGPLAYLPQATAILGGRLAGLGPLALLYAARLANALVAIAVLSLAVALMPGGRWVSLSVGLLPMAVFEYGSVSADGSVIASAFLVTALLLRGLARGRWTWPKACAAAFAGAILCTTKLPYAPLLLLGVPAVLRRECSGRTRLTYAAIVAIALGAGLLWLRSLSGIAVVPFPGADRAAQASLVARDPLRFLTAMRHAVLWDAGTLARQLVGVLGWLTLPLPGLCYGLAAVGVSLGLVASAVEAPRLTRVSAAWGLGLVLACCALVALALYLFATPVGRDVVIGVQGRYFLPVLAACGPCTAAFVPARPNRRLAALAGLAGAVVVLVNLMVTHATVARAYGIV